LAVKTLLEKLKACSTIKIYVILSLLIWKQDMETGSFFEKIKSYRVAIIAVCASVIIAILILATNPNLFSGGAKGSAKPAVDVSVVVVEPIDIPVVLEFSGETVSSRIVEVRPRVSGILQKTLFVEGDIVREGQPLFQIEPDQYTIALRSAEAELAKAQAQLDQAVRDEARLKFLRAKDVSSQKDYDDAKSRLELAKAGLDSAKAQVDEAKLNLGYTTIYAPVSGVISKTNRDEGSLLSATGDNVLTKITQLDPIYVNFSMSETEYVKIHQDVAKGFLKMPPGEDLPVDMYYGNGIKFNHVGKLNFSDAEFSKGSGVMQIRATFPNPDNKLIGGQFVRIVIRGGIRPNALTIPKRAIIESVAGKKIFVVNGTNIAELRDITEGPKFKDFVQIISGVSADDKVVVDGFLRLQPGEQVNITEKIEEAPKVDKISDMEEQELLPSPTFLEG
jgi:membrane fusion protein (multidrug efflux system)